MVSDVEYRWWATGHDGCIGVDIRPANNLGTYISGTLLYHEGGVHNEAGNWSPEARQIVVTNRIVRRIIEHAITSFGYVPEAVVTKLRLAGLDDVVEWRDEVRAVRRDSPYSMNWISVNCVDMVM